MLFAHGVDSIGLAPIERWCGFLARARARGRFVGVVEEASPAVFATFARYHPALRAIPGRCPLPPPLTWGQLETFLDQSDIAARAGVTVRDAAAD